MKFDSSVDIYISKGIKNYKKSLVSLLQKKLSSYDMNLLESFEDIDQESVLITTLDQIDYDLKKLNFELKYPPFIIEFEELTLDLFNSENDIDNGEVFYIKERNIDDEFDEALMLINEIHKTEYRAPLLKKTERDFKKISILAAQYIEDMNWQKGDAPPFFVELAKSFYGEVLSENDESLIEEIFIKFLKKNLGIRKIESLANLAEEDDYLLIPVIKNVEDINIFQITSPQKVVESPKSCFILAFTTYLLKSYYEFLINFERFTFKEDVILETFQVLDWPMALFTEKGELLHHNKWFVDLKIPQGECFKLLTGDHWKNENKTWRCHRREYNNDKGCFYFFSFTLKTEEDTTISNDQELGIVTSSMAHELNNPLAGILAALTLLRLDDFWSEENLRELDEIEKGAKRCKNLIDVFLGFSKKSTMQKHCIGIEEIIDNALGILNFRVVETNVKLQFEWKIDDDSLEQRDFNDSILSMVFYLIFGELITSYSHYLLVSDKSEDKAVLSGVIRSLPGEVSITLTQDFKFKESLEKLELVQHLLKLQHISMAIRDNTLILSFEDRS